ncbi:MAG: GTPase Era [Sandaracinus sp.]|nr:GTPase Era [Sandaracinus sp.]MCB9635044.1 GTPase Era [Sandaracinus sp.]
MGAPEDSMEEREETPRAGRVAIVGRPNVGKSTLMNKLLGQRLAIATPKPGTTRTAILGVYASENPPTQIAFVDTPGMLTPRSALHEVLVEQAQLGIAEADVVVFLTESPADARGEKPNLEVRDADRPALSMLEGSKAPVILAVNKVDRLKNKQLMLPFLEAYQALHPFTAVVPVSARTGVNLDALVKEIRLHLPEGLLYEDPDFLTDRPTRFFVAEMIREAVLRHVQKEVPYGAAVVIDRMEEGKLTRIHATVVVEKDGHKGIVIGKGGERLKTIGTEARQAIESFLECRVHLELWVKVVDGWTHDANKARRLATEGTT